MEYFFNLVRSSVNKCVRVDKPLKLWDLADRLRQIMDCTRTTTSNSKFNNPPTENLSLRSRPAREWNDSVGESPTALLPRLGLKPEANS
jgi:hypothetical protein